MRKVLCLFSVLAFLLSAPAFAHDPTDVGVDVKVYKIFDFDELGLTISAAPTYPQLDTTLRFERPDPATGWPDFARVDHERLHYRSIERGPVIKS